jgi:hypothetical protein
MPRSCPRDGVSHQLRPRNALYKSAIQRAVQPPQDQRGYKRLGVFYFCYLNDDDLELDSRAAVCEPSSGTSGNNRREGGKGAVGGGLEEGMDLCV